MQSIDRKLARLAREIEAAKPKCMGVGEFERRDYGVISTTKGGLYFISEEDCRQVKRVAPAPKAPDPQAPLVAAPPKFRKGDRVAHVIDPTNEKFERVVISYENGFVRYDLHYKDIDHENYLRPLSPKPEVLAPGVYLTDAGRGEWFNKWDGVQWLNGRVSASSAAHVTATSEVQNRTVIRPATKEELKS